MISYPKCYNKNPPILNFKQTNTHNTSPVSRLKITTWNENQLWLLGPYQPEQ